MQYGKNQPSETNNLLVIEREKIQVKLELDFKRLGKLNHKFSKEAINARVVLTEIQIIFQIKIILKGFGDKFPCYL